MVVEINPHFCKHIQKNINDPRLHVYNGSALDLRAAVEKQGWNKVDVVCSGIPFSTIPHEVGYNIVKAVRDVLQPGGLFVAYQVRDRVKKLGNNVFGDPTIQTEPRNIPPMQIYTWQNAHK